MIKTKEDVMGLLLQFFHNQEDLDKWLDFPHPSLGDKTPRSIMELEYGPDAVFTLVDLTNWGGVGL